MVTKILSKEQIENRLKMLKEKYKVKLYTPYKYFEGLKSINDVDTRFQRILKGSKSKSNDSKSYTPFETDVKAKTKTSKYTKAFYTLYPGAKSLKQKSQVTGIPLHILEKVYNKGLAAWRTGHRLGASQQAWGYARVHSFIMLGCAAFTSDKSLFVEAISKMKNADISKLLKHNVMCTKSVHKNDLFKVN